MAEKITEENQRLKNKYSATTTDFLIKDKDDKRFKTINEIIAEEKANEKAKKRSK